MFVVKNFLLTQALCMANSTGVIGVQEDVIWLDRMILPDGMGGFLPFDVGDQVKFKWYGDGTFYGGQYDMERVGHFGDITIFEVLDNETYRIMWNSHNVGRTLGYFNCYTFSNGVESNRIRDDYNAVTIDKGVKASMPLAEEYKETRKSSSFIFSGIYNSTSGVNRTNQFIQAEPITKDLNPINGSIQKLFARDTDLITFCENKVFRILANKDALFSAGGDTNVTSTSRVLGQAIPFTGEYGISKNPESFASESYRIYFADKARGSILRLSRDGITPISDAGMKDWFRDKLRFSTSLIGSYDQRDDHYNLTIETTDQDGNDEAYTASYTEARKGWESFKSFLTQGGISHKNIYYTFPSNRYCWTNERDVWGISFKGSPDWGELPVAGDDNYPRSLDAASAEMFQHSLDIKITRLFDKNGDGYVGGGTEAGPSPTQRWIKLDRGYQGQIKPGMNIEGDGIPLGTTVAAVYDCENPYSACSATIWPQPKQWLQITNAIDYIKHNTVLTFSTRRSNFYGVSHYAMIKPIHIGNPGMVKRFKTLDYEGTQAKVSSSVGDRYQLHESFLNTTATTNSGQVYYNNRAKLGWFAETIETDLQKGTIKEFIDKENKWYNYIQGFEDAGIGDGLDTSEFSLQGIGQLLNFNEDDPNWNSGSTPPPPPLPPEPK